MKKGWIKEEEKWSYYRKNKKLNTTFVKANNHMYYLEKDGELIKGWSQATK